MNLQVLLNFAPEMIYVLIISMSLIMVKKIVFRNYLNKIYAYGKCIWWHYLKMFVSFIELDMASARYLRLCRASTLLKLASDRSDDASLPYRFLCRFQIVYWW